MTSFQERGPRLTVSVAEPASASPFPSPSSSFLPPPTAGAHEFAVKPPPMGKNAKKSSLTNGSIMASPEEIKEPNIQNPSVEPVSTANSPTTPTPSAIQSARRSSDVFQPLQMAQTTATPTTTANPPTNPPPPPPPISRTLTPTSPTFYPIPSSSTRNSNRDSTASLSSNRPAPPSPAVSRRTSTVLSRANSNRRSPAHRQSMQSATSHRDSFNMPNMTTSQTITSAMSATPSSSVSRRSLKPPPRIYIKIRDFGYPVTDERHTGAGTDVPKANRIGFLNKHLRSSSTSSSSTSTSQDDDETEGQDTEDDAWNNFQWGMGRLSWQFGASAPKETDADRPSNNDFDRNFVDDSSQDDDDDDDDEFAYEDEANEGPLQPGLYRAMYAFEPEGTAEMALAEEQIVRVIGRGGGVGWAVVDKAYLGENAPKDSVAGEGHALVPESYLEPMKLDWPDDE